MYRDLKIKMTPPSDWRELSKTEVANSRLSIASQLKSAALMSDFDIYTNYLGFDKQQTKEMISRLKIQKLEDLKIAIIGQNPSLLGIGMPENNDQEVGVVPGISDGGLELPQQEQNPEANLEGETPELNQENPEPQEGENQEIQDQESQEGSPKPLPIPDKEKIKKYGLDIDNYEANMDY